MSDQDDLTHTPTDDDAPAYRPSATGDDPVEDGDRPADPLAPGESILDDDGDIVEPNEPA